MIELIIAVLIIGILVTFASVSITYEQDKYAYLWTSADHFVRVLYYDSSGVAYDAKYMASVDDYIWDYNLATVCQTYNYSGYYFSMNIIGTGACEWENYSAHMKNTV